MKQESTIKDVASWAGVSCATVSRYLNKTRSFPEAVTQKIDAAITELNYSPNAAAKSLKQKKTHVIGLIVPDMIVYSYIYKTIESLLYENGYILLICDSSYSPAKENAQLHNLVRQRVDGIFIASSGHNSNYIHMILEQKIPIVMFNRYQPELPKMHYVLEPGKEMMKKIISYAIDLGHRKFAYFKGPSDATVSEEKFQIFTTLLQEHHIPLNTHYYFDNVTSEEEIRKASNEVLDHLDDVSIVVSTNAKQIKYFIMTCHERHIKIPDQVSVTGFGLEEYKSLFSVPVTCAIQNHNAIGQRCVEEMMSLLANPDSLSIRKITYVGMEFFKGATVKKL